MIESRQDGWMAKVWIGIKQPVEALVADLAAQTSEVSHPVTTLRINPSGIEVLRRDGQRMELILEATGRADVALKSVISRLGIDLPADCGLEFAPGMTVSSEMVLPAESHEILKAIVRNKVEGFSPWPLSQCLFGQRIASIAGDAAHVAVDVAVVSKGLIQEISSVLSEAGVSVTAAHVRLPDGEALRLDFGGEDVIRKVQQRAWRVASVIGMIALLVAVYGFYVVWQSSHELAKDRDKIAALMTSLHGNGSVQGGPPIVAAANMLYQQRQQRPPAVSVLNELSELLPQTVWLVSLSLDGEQLELKGSGTDVPQLIDILEASETFRDVNFAAATELNEDQNESAFSIGATLMSGGPDGSAP